MRLGGLRLEDLLTLSAAVTGNPLSPRAARRLWLHTEGHPMHARAMLEELGGGQPDLTLTYLERTKGEDFSAEVNRLLEHDPSLAKLDDAQKRKFFALWSERGDLARHRALRERQLIRGLGFSPS